MGDDGVFNNAMFDKKGGEIGPWEVSSDHVGTKNQLFKTLIGYPLAEDRRDKGMGEFM